MDKGSSGGKGRYNRLSLTRHDKGIKREPWQYRKPPKRKSRSFVSVRRYRWTGTRWERVA